MITILTHNLTPITTVPKVLNAEISERLSGEYTLNFTTLWREVNAAQIEVGGAAQVNGQYFDIVAVTKEQDSDGWRKISAECEHVSYRLNDISADYFTFIAAPSAMLGEILSGSNASPAGRFTVGSVVSGSIETFSLQEAASTRGLISAYARYIGAEVQYDNFSVSLVAHPQSTLTLRRGNTKSQELLTLTVSL